MFEYEVSAVLSEDDVELVQLQRRVFAPDFFLPETPTGVPGSCVFRLSELRCFGHYVFRVRPLECFGKRGAELDSERIVLKRPARTKASAKTSAKTPSKVQK